MAEIIDMPKLSDTMTIGTIAQWLKKEGDTVSPGDMIAEIETDKATMEMECFVSGVLLKQYAKAGSQVTVGDPICAIGNPGEKIPEGSAKAPAAEQPKTAEPQPKSGSAKTAPAKPAPDQHSELEPLPPQPPVFTAPPKAESPQGSGAATIKDSRIKASPLARKIAGEQGVDLATIEGSGPGGRIIRKDVLEASTPAPSAAAPETRAQTTASASPQKPSPVEILESIDIPVSTMRSAIATRLLESKTRIPHFYLDIEVDMEPLLTLRESVNRKLTVLPVEKGGIKLSVNDFILKATIEALRQVPAANASWMEKNIRRHGEIHLAFAVAVEDGLVTPTIKNAHLKSLRQIASEAKELITKAQSKKLKPDEMSGSTFTVTNLGMYGIYSFYGIINPPNAAILSVGATLRKPVVNAKGEIVPGQRMHIGLSGDHRVIDGAVGAQFLSALKDLIENPALMLV